MVKNSRGFTLIELLVVVAIIGILAAVVLANLNGARVKGTDAAIKGELAGSRAQAELFYDASGQVYTNICTAAGGISPMVLSSAQKITATNTVGDNTEAFVPNVLGGAGSAVCHDSDTAWAAAVSFKGIVGSGWCVDSSGASREVTTLPADEFVCP